MSRLTRPKLSRRIYARRAAGSGILISSAGIIQLLSPDPGRPLTLWLVLPAAIFAIAFSTFLREIFMVAAAPRTRERRGLGALMYPITFVAAPVAAPLILVTSTLQFVRAKQ